MSKVSQAKVEEILSAIQATNPEFKFVGRDQEGWHRLDWQLWTVWVGLKIMGLFNPNFVKRWNERYVAVTSRHMLFPTKPTDFSDFHRYVTLRHEYIHIRDRQKHPLWFPFSYVMVLPLVWTMRSHWELRGYTANMIVEFEERGHVSDATLDHIEKQFTTDRYLWMWPFKKRVRAHLEDVRQKVMSGEISGLYF